MRVLNQDKPPLDEDLLAHYGVRGMKWGVRKGKSQTGQGRFAGARTQANDRMIRARTKAATRNKLIYGGAKYQQKRIKKLEESNKRIAEGKMKVRDILDIYSRVGYTDLIFTKTPK